LFLHFLLELIQQSFVPRLPFKLKSYLLHILNSQSNTHTHTHTHTHTRYTLAKS
jgi:hypothetical protein